MIMDGCQGKPRTPTIEDRICPNCGNPIEIFSTDTEVACDKCGFVVYNDKLSCVQWCKYAKQCVGEETYEKLMIIARRNQEKADAERRARLEAKREQEGSTRNGLSSPSTKPPARAAACAPRRAMRARSPSWTGRRS